MLFSQFIVVPVQQSNFEMSEQLVERLSINRVIKYDRSCYSRGNLKILSPPVETALAAPSS